LICVKVIKTMDMTAIKRLLRRTGIGRGRCFKTEVSMSAKLRLYDLEAGKGLTSWIKGSTRQVAEDGFVMGVDQVMVDGFHIFTDAMKQGRMLELEWELPAEGGALAAKGQVLWFKLAPDGCAHPFEAGVLLVEMGADQKEQWLKFTRGLPD
jgi:hypothetical protein